MLIELRRLYKDIDNFNWNSVIPIVVWAAYFGDPEFALDAAIKAHTLGLFECWAPLMGEVRRLPRFKEWVREIGVVDYWKEYGWPDLCRPVGDDDFVCN